MARAVAAAGITNAIDVRSEELAEKNKQRKTGTWPHRGLVRQTGIGSIFSDTWFDFSSAGTCRGGEAGAAR